MEQEDHLKKQKLISNVDGEEDNGWSPTVASHSDVAQPTSDDIVPGGPRQECHHGYVKEANKILRFAKHHADVHLQFCQPGEPRGLLFMIYSDAAFASRRDFSKVAICASWSTTKSLWAKRATTTARSSLSAEPQAASEAAVALLYTCIFWRLLWTPHLDLEAMTTARLGHALCLIIAMALC